MFFINQYLAFPNMDLYGSSVLHAQSMFKTLPTIGSAFSTLSSFCIKVAHSSRQPSSARQQVDEHPHLPKHLKIEKNTLKTHNNIPKIFIALQTIIHRQAHQDRENLILRDLMVTQLAPKLGL